MNQKTKKNLFVFNALILMGVASLFIFNNIKEVKAASIIEVRNNLIILKNKKGVVYTYESCNLPDKIAVDNAKVMNEIYSKINDIFDYAVIITNFHSCRALHQQGVKNEITGIGLSFFDATYNFGSKGKLKGVVRMGSIEGLKSNPYYNRDTFLHEMGHNWGVFINSDLKTSNNTHWKNTAVLGSKKLDPMFDGMGGCYSCTDEFCIDDCEEGQYPYRYSDLTQYLMGLVSKNDILNEKFSLAEYDYVSQKYKIKKSFSINDIITLNSERTPSSGVGQKNFKVGFILVTDEQGATLEEIETVKEIMSLYKNEFSVATDYKANIDYSVSAMDEVKLSDLIISDITYSNANFYVKYCNQGDGSSDKKFSIKLSSPKCLSCNITIGGDSMKYTAPAPSQCATSEAVGKGWLGIAATDYSVDITAIIDNGNQIIESNENNNTFLTTVIIGRNLFVTSPIGGNIWVRGQTYPITWASSPNNLISRVNISLYTGQATYDIAKNIFNSGSYDWLILPGLAENNIYRIIITNVDNDKDFTESDKFALTNTLKPDLIITDIFTEPISFKAGEKFQWKATVKNIGGADADLTVRHSQTPHFGVVVNFPNLSNNHNFNTQCSLGEFAGNFDRILKPGQSVTGYPCISQNFSLEQGPYKIKAVADNGNAINESNENNNSLEKTITISPPSSVKDKPDLVFSDLKVDTTNPVVGQKVKFTYTVKNIGTALSKGYYVIWTGNSGIYTGSSEDTPGNCAWSSLNPGMSGSCVEYRRYDTAGSFIAGWKIDPYNEIDELNENNNSLEKTITISNTILEKKPDLFIEDIIYFNKEKFYVKYCNLGKGGSNNKFSIKLSSSKCPTCNIIIGEDLIRPLPTLGCATSKEVGEDWLGVNENDKSVKIKAFVDYENVIAESNENNNTLEKTIYVSSGEIVSSQKIYSISSSPASVLADGEAISNVVVLAKDDQGNPISGKQISISSSRGSLDVIKTIIGTTSSEGKAVFSVSSKTEGISTYTAIVDGSVINQTTQVTFRKPEAIYPEGTLIQVKGDATIYVIKEGEKKPIPSPSVLRDNGYSFEKVITVEKSVSEQYPTGDVNLYRDGKVLKYGNDIYVISHQKRKKIASPDALKRFGYKKIIEVTKEIIDSYPEGEPLNATDLYPEGTLLKASNSPAVYYLWQGQIRPIYSAQVFNAYNNQWQDVVTVSPAEIKKYPKGGVFYFPKGALIKQAGKPAVYLIDDNNKKRPIISGEIFEKIGFEWENINEAEVAVINRYPIGDVIKE